MVYEAPVSPVSRSAPRSNFADCMISSPITWPSTGDSRPRVAAHLVPAAAASQEQDAALKEALREVEREHRRKAISAREVDMEYLKNMCASDASGGGGGACLLRALNTHSFLARSCAPL